MFFNLDAEGRGSECAGGVRGAPCWHLLPGGTSRVYLGSGRAMGAGSAAPLGAPWRGAVRASAHAGPGPIVDGVPYRGHREVSDKIIYINDPKN